MVHVNLPLRAGLALAPSVATGEPAHRLHRPALSAWPEGNRVAAPAWIEMAKAWVRDCLPALNSSACSGRTTSDEVIRLVNGLLRGAPPPREFADRQAMQALMILGVCGSSVERHAQQSQRRAGEPAIPGRGIEKLIAAGRRPFLEYVGELADRFGHMHRDSFVTFIERNGPAVRVLHPKTRRPFHALPAGFDDGAYLTFTGRAEEIELIRLLKEAAALQGAANLFLVRLQDAATAVDNAAAVSDCFDAAVLLLAVRAKIVELLGASSSNADLLDVLRQYACDWRDHAPLLRPPSGANDGGFLHRDMLLFSELLPPSGPVPGYRTYVRHTVLPALMPEVVARIEAAMSSDSIEARLYCRLGTTRDVLGRIGGRSCDALLDANPWLAAYVLVYAAQRALSRAHYEAASRFLLEPARAQDARNSVVPSTHGNGQMDLLHLVRQLDAARAAHPLATLGAQIGAGGRLDAILRDLGHRRRSHAELLSLCPRAGEV